MKKPSVKESASAATRTSRVGRRPKLGHDGEPASVTKEEIVRHAAQLAQREHFSEITMVRLGRELGVAPGLIHYFVGSRDELLSLVINSALKERAEGFPALTGDWRADLAAVLRQTLEMQLRWKGITTYVASHNKYRLFQNVSGDEQDYGVVFFDHIGRILKSGGFTAPKAAMAYHLLMLFLTAVASAHVNRQEPSAHREYILEHLSRFPAPKFAGSTFLAKDFTAIDTEKSFRQGLQILLDGIEGWLPARHRQPTRPS